MPPPEKKPPTNRADRDVAADSTATLAAPVIRLPLGRKNARAYPDGHKKSVFSLRNPTSFGGDLTIDCTPSNGSRMTLSRTLGGAALASSTSGTLTYAIPRGAAHVGTYYLIIDQPSASAAARLIQVGCSREAPSESAKPFVPWNFWYWPTARRASFPPPKDLTKAEKTLWDDYAKSSDADANYWTYRARRVLSAFGQLDGSTDPTAGGSWETTHHQKQVGKGWEGHCHFAAVASVIFEQPTAREAGGFNYLANDLELLGAEFAGRFCHVLDLPDVFRLDTHPVNVLEIGILDLLKPEGANDEAELKDSLEKIVPADTKAGTAGKEAMFKEFLKRYKSAFPGGAAEVKNELGRKAAAFFLGLQYELRDSWAPCIGDFRAGESDGNPEEVWNHALFMYEADFIESSPTGDDKRYDVDCTLSCNKDVEPPDSDSAPANINGNRIRPDPKRSVQFDHSYRLSFDDSGEVSVGKSPEWLRCRKVGSSEKLFAPRYLKSLTPPSKTPAPRPPPPLMPGQEPKPPPPPGTFGNANVTWGVINRGLLKLRDRYK
jgi:hypothetical protein